MIIIFSSPLLQFPFTQIASQVLAKYCTQNTYLQLGKLSTQYKLKIKTYNKTRTKYTVHIEDKDIEEKTKYTVHIKDKYLQ